MSGQSIGWFCLTETRSWPGCYLGFGFKMLLAVLASTIVGERTFDVEEKAESLSESTASWLGNTDSWSGKAESWSGRAELLSESAKSWSGRD